MSDIRIDLTDEDVDGVTLENIEGFEWTISLGNLHVTITDAQLLALAEVVKRWGEA